MILDFSLSEFASFILSWKGLFVLWGALASVTGEYSSGMMCGVEPATGVGDVGRLYELSLGSLMFLLGG